MNAVEWAWNQDVKRGNKLVLLDLARRHGVAMSPSIPDISKTTGYSERRVGEVIAYLEARGLIAVKRAEGVRNLYIVNPPKDPDWLFVPPKGSRYG